VSQQIKTPQSLIKGGLEILEDDVKSLCKDDEEAVSIMGLIENAQVSIVQAIDAMLSFMDFECAKDEDLRLDVRTMPPRNILSDRIVKTFRMYARSKNIQISTEVSEDMNNDVYFLRADESKLHVVVRNLFSNALQYTQSGGQVSIRQLIDHSSDGPAFLKIEVADTGIGIDPSLQHKLFQAPSEHKKSEAEVHMDGSGMGLYISRKIVRLHGGDISYKSSGLNLGTTFTVSIPLYSREVENNMIGLEIVSEISESSYIVELPEYDENSQPVDALTNLPRTSTIDHGISKVDLRILIIDSSSSCMSLAGILKKYFRAKFILEVALVNDSISAMNAISESVQDGVRGFDFVLVGYSFDVTSGLAIVRRIKEVQGFSACIIGIVSDSSVDKVSDFLSYGAHVVLANPIDPDTLGKILMDKVLQSIFF
jgi:two-component sensor histidine kinase/CheY-like chemotaxis protein